MKKWRFPAHWPLSQRLAYHSTIAPNGCHLWIGLTYHDGYGMLWWNGRVNRAHRLSWESKHGPIPAGMLVCHTCDEPLCINPDHLWLGTNAENLADMRTKGRASTEGLWKGQRPQP